MNKEKLNKYLWIILILCLFNCKTFYRQDFLKEKFSPLEKESFIVEFDKSSLGRSGIDEIYWISDLGEYGYPNEGKLSNLENYLKLKNSNISKPKRLVIIARKLSWSETGVWYLLTPTYFLAPTFWLGVPNTTETMNLIIEGYVVSNDNKILKKYTASAENTEYSALYWGYYARDLHTPVLFGVMAKALNSLRGQIENDYK